jgi:FemAB-related protein (PEP-CTERM system-associated)
MGDSELSAVQCAETQARLSVRQVDFSAELRDPWDDYVESHSLGTVFHTAAWQRLIEASLGHRPVHLIAESVEDRRIVGVFPLFIVRSLLFGKMLISTPQGAYGGILADSTEVAQVLLSKAQEMARERAVRFLEVRNSHECQIAPGLSTKDLYVTFRQELFPDSERNMHAIPRKTRAEIREGVKNNLEFRVDAINLDEFFEIYSHNLRDLGTPIFPRRLFTNGPKEFGRRCKVFSVHWRGKAVAAVWTLFFKDEILPYYGGSIREYNRLAVNNFMYWMLIRYGCENGYRIFDFGRSKKGTGSFDFKKRWGMTMTDLPYQYYLVKATAPPDTSPLNPKFSLGIRLWRRLPLPLANSLGPLVSRHLT